MSDSEKEKDVTCFEADGIVAEMVIEVEENHKLGSDDLPSSPAKDSHCDKEDESVNESKELEDTIRERTEESQLIESDSEKENKDNSIESIEADDKNEEHIEDKRSEERSCDIVEDNNPEEENDYFMEEQSEEQNNSIVEDKTFDLVIQDSEDKKSDEINDKIVDNTSTEINESSEVEEKIDNKASEITEKSDSSFSEINEKIDKPSEETVDKKSTEIKEKVDKKSTEIKEKADKKSTQIKEKADKKSTEIKDKVNNHSSRIKQKNFKSKQNLKKKRPCESIMDASKNDIKESDMPRYSEAKRRKVEEDSKEREEKKNISKETVTKKSIEKESGESLKESDKTNLGRSLRTRKSDVESENTSSKQNVKSDVESEKSASKQSVLRKLPFRKNKDAPDVPDLKPKVFWWNGVGEGQGCKLGDIPEIRGRIQKAKSIRALYRVLFFQWPANGQDVIGEILKFNGFPFDKSSYEYSKRQSLMKIMLDKTIFHMCELLDIRKGDKQSCIKNILEFLLNPSLKVDPATDPRWQPVVIIERIKIDDAFLHESSNVKQRKSVNSAKKDARSNFSTPTRLTRSSRPIEIELVVTPGNELEESQEDAKSNKAKLSTPIESNRSSRRSLLKSNVKENASITKDLKMSSSSSRSLSKNNIKENVSPIKDSKMNSASSKRSVLKSTVKENTPTTKESKISGTSSSKKTTPVTVKTKSSISVKDEKAKNTSVVKDSKEKVTPAKKDVKSSPKALKSKPDEIKNNVTTKLERRKKFNKRRKKIIGASSKKEPAEKEEALNTQSDEDSEEYEIEMTVDSGPDIDEDVEMNDADEENPDSVKTAEQKSKTQTPKTPGVTLKTAVSSFILSDSSETESAEETKLVTAAKTTSKVPMKRKGKPLRHFPKVSDSIQHANFSALQRLHILLFGASDKAENLKSNILSFGGFPFLEGSDEWKQKHFLLSLLAQNNLREYLNLLCIPYAHDDQPTMINKLMKFLAVPSEELLESNSKIHAIETEVVSSVLVDKSSPVAPPPKSKTEIKKKVKKKEDKRGKRQRKVLMSEEEARRLEANFAREQRALARERKHIMKTYIPIAPLPPTATAPSLNMHNYVPQPKPSLKQAPVSDPEQLNALLQTVYKRRALKAAGAVVSTPNKGQRTKLGEIENVKFLIVTSNISDLEILHRLIFMLEASKSRIRKNILDFDGFGFNEDSPKYKHRMDYLNSLGYEASKRISFLLGLCPLNTNLPQTDLNELIMYFLMSPCKTKQTVPITQMPADEPHIIVKSTAPLANAMYSIQNVNVPLTPPVSSTKSQILKKSLDKTIVQHSTPKSGTQKAKKTFPSSSKISPVKKVLLPPTQAPGLGVASLGNKPQKMSLLNSVPAVPSYSLPKTTVSNSLNNVALLNTGSLILNPPKTINPLAQVPVSPGTKLQVLNQSPKVSVIDPKTPVSLPNVPLTLSNVPGQVLQNQILIPQVPDKNNLQPLQMQTPLLSAGSKMLVKSTPGVAASPEFIVQQQTPDGQQKIFKLIRLPPTHPLVSNTAVNKPPVQQTISSPQLSQQLLLTSNTPLSGTLPPGLIIMKNNPSMPPMHILPSAPMKMLSLSSATSPVSSIITTSQPKTSQPQTEKVTAPDKNESASADTSWESMEASEDSPPTDEDLFSSIQEVILSSNFEDITLRNVIDRVAAQYKNHDLTHRHNYMKECVKKIIMGTG